MDDPRQLPMGRGHRARHRHLALRARRLQLHEVRRVTLAVLDSGRRSCEWRRTARTTAHDTPNLGPSRDPIRADRAGKRRIELRAGHELAYSAGAGVSGGLTDTPGTAVGFAFEKAVDLSGAEVGLANVSRIRSEQPVLLSWSQLGTRWVDELKSCAADSLSRSTIQA